MNTQKFARICTECKKGMNTGYLVNNGEAYYCSDECLHKHHTPEEWNEMSADDNDENYYTEWEERDVDFSKKFLYVDKSGRGFKGTFTYEQLLQMDNIENYDARFLFEWAEEAEEGDEFENNANKYTCIN